MHVCDIWSSQFGAGLVCMASPAAFLEPGSPISPLQSSFCSSSSAGRSRYCPLWTSSETWQVCSLIYTQCLHFGKQYFYISCTIQYIVHKDTCKHYIYIHIHHSLTALCVYFLDPSDQCIIEGNDCTIVSDLSKIKLQENSDTLGK